MNNTEQKNIDTGDIDDLIFAGEEWYISEK